MNAFARNTSGAENALARATSHFQTYARGSTYRRLSSTLSQQFRHNGIAQRTALPYAALAPLRSQFLPSDLRLRPLTPARAFHLTAFQAQEDKLKSTDPKTEDAAEKVEGKDKADAEEAKNSETGNEEGKDGKEEKDGKEDKEGEDAKKKEDMPPPPPHGDKTPWQVFMETMNTEFEKSKDWNESTKQIGAAAHQFSESESVRRAREAYEKSTGAVSSAASGAVKSTASAIGKGAAWTWDTSVVKGVRKAANVTGDVVDKATKPIRDTEAYKNVKEVIDDGSSSRYGGWVEKEERRKKRELREGTRGGPDVLQEDPE